MASGVNKIITLNDSRCACCAKTIFHFEGRVRMVDLDDSENAVCASMKKGASESDTVAESLERNDTVLCVSCYRKTQKQTGPAESETENSEVGDTDVKVNGNTHKNTEGQRIANADLGPRADLKQPIPKAVVLTSDPHQQGLNKERPCTEKATDFKLNSNTNRGADSQGTDSQGTDSQGADSGKIMGDNEVTRLAVGVGVLLVVMAIGGAGIMAYVAVGTILVIVVMATRGRAGRWFHHIMKWCGLENTASDKKDSPIPQDMASSITSGGSLAGTSTYSLLVQNEYSVTCGIEVENWTRFPLILPHVQIKGGALIIAPSTIVPAVREVMVARKTAGTATGSYGTVSWLVQDTGRRLVVMWSAPFNFNHHSNWLGVGLTASGTTDDACEDAWFDQMYYGESSPQLGFDRSEYYASIRPVLYRDADFEVEGIMASDHKAVVKIILRPRDPNNFASSLKKMTKQK